MGARERERRQRVDILRPAGRAHVVVSSSAGDGRYAASCIGRAPCRSPRHPGPGRGPDRTLSRRVACGQLGQGVRGSIEGTRLARVPAGLRAARYLRIIAATTHRPSATSEARVRSFHSGGACSTVEGSSELERRKLRVHLPAIDCPVLVIACRHGALRIYRITRFHANGLPASGRHGSREFGPQTVHPPVGAACQGPERG